MYVNSELCKNAKEVRLSLYGTDVLGTEGVILYAEDERDIRDLVTFALLVAGYEMIPVPDGAEALRIVTNEKVDLVLLDVRMPKMTGYEVCRALKSKSQTAHIPIIFLSAKGQEAEINTGLGLGAEEYFLKPFSPEDLTKRINHIFQRIRLGIYEED